MCEHSEALERWEEVEVPQPAAAVARCQQPALPKRRLFSSCSHPGTARTCATVSRPAMMGMIARCWMGDGFSKPCAVWGGGGGRRRAVPASRQGYVHHLTHRRCHAVEEEQV